jgi:hypothetical protein
MVALFRIRNDSARPSDSFSSRHRSCGLASRKRQPGGCRVTRPVLPSSICSIPLHLFYLSLLACTKQKSPCKGTRTNLHSRSSICTHSRPADLSLLPHLSCCESSYIITASPYLHSAHAIFFEPLQVMDLARTNLTRPAASCRCTNGIRDSLMITVLVVPVRAPLDPAVLAHIN